MARNPNWTVEEIVLATELLLNHEFRVVGSEHPDVVVLSKLLNELRIHSPDRRNDEFRSPSSIDLKLANIRSMNPDWVGGATNASRLDDYFWRVLDGKSELLHHEAASIRAKYGTSDLDVDQLDHQSSKERRAGSTTGRRRLDELPIQEIHRQRLEWFLDHEGEIVTFRELSSVKDPCLVSRPTGIYRPSGWEHALSVRETLLSDYGDVPIRNLPDGGWVYRYHREDGVNRPTNAGLLECLRDEIPVGVLIQVQAKPDARYIVAGLGVVRDFNTPWFEIVNWHTGEATPADDRDVVRYVEGLGDRVKNASEPGFLEVAIKESYSRQLVRPNQPLFRFMLLNSYRKRCAITESEVVPVLEAAHIRPYSFDRIDTVQNGLLLRADVHRLFDRGFLGVDVSMMRTLLSRELHGTEYESLEGKTLLLPDDSEYHPSVEYLDEHRRQWQLS